MMEVDSRTGDEGPPALSPQRGRRSPAKVIDEDDSLGYTITMNDGDESNNSSASHSRTATPTTEQDSSETRSKRPPRLKPQQIVENGDDSSREGSGSGKGKSERRSSKENGVGRSSEKHNKEGDKANKDKEEASKVVPKEEPALSTRTLRPRRSLEQKEGERKSYAEKESESEDDDSSEDSSDSSESEVEEKSGSSNKKKAAKKKKEEVEEIVMDSDEENEKSPEGSKKNKGDKLKGRNTPSPSAQAAKDKLASPNAKQALAEKLASSSTNSSKTTSVVLDARTGVSLPYVPTSNATSLLPPTSGVRLVLPPGASAGQVMYIPSTGTYLTSTGSMFPATTTMACMAAGSSTPILIPAVAATTTPISSTHSYFVSGMGGMTAGVIRPPVGSAPPMQPIPTFENSSKGMLDMVRWEADNHINIKPKYAKPNPKAELGNLARWLFELGADVVKESVYHDLVRLQRQRKDSGGLTDKEKADFTKLQEIDADLNKKIGHLKFKLPKSCKCGFKADLDSVLYLHKEHAHHDRGGFLNCSMCKYSSRQPSAFKFHMEAEHGMCGRMENRPCFFECELCPYESNYPNRLDQHKVRCLKQFRPNFNMHPSCLTGPEVNLCLENVFYFVFTRQFLNTINPPSSASTSLVPSTGLKDIKPRTVSQTLASIRPGQNMVGKFGVQVSTTPPQQLAGKNTIRTGTGQYTGYPASANISRSFPVISSQIGGNTGSAPRAPSYAAAIKQPPTTGQQPNAQSNPNNAFEVCEICGGYVKDRKALRIHFFYAHRIDMPFGVFERTQPPLYCATCFARFWTAQGLQKHIEVHKADMAGASTAGNGVAGKCISCGHRVPNILMHMRMVHNRELRHYLAALMCIFCGNRFSSKREVENHMGSQHGVVVKNSSAQGSPLTPGILAQPTITPKPPKHKMGPASKTRMNRGSQCVLCNLTFARNVDLTRHCMRVHHTCMKCGLVVVDKESLNRHTCLHSAAGMRTCQICGESGFHPAYYIKHMRDKHLHRCSVVMRRIDREAVDTLKRPITISDSEDDDVMIQSRSEPSSPKRQKQDDEKDSSDEKEKPNPQPRRRQVARRSTKFKVPKMEDKKEDKCDVKADTDSEERKNGDITKKSSETVTETDSDANRSEKTSKEKSKSEKTISEKSKSEKTSSEKSKSEKTSTAVNKSEKTSSAVKNSEKKSSEVNKSEQTSSEVNKSEKTSSEVNKSEKTNSEVNKSERASGEVTNKVSEKTGVSSRTDKKRKSDENKNSSKKSAEKKRKSAEDSDNSCDEEVGDAYSKKLRRSGRGNTDALELD